MSTTANKTQPPRKLEQTNVYRLSNRTPFRKAIFLSKIILKKHGSIQIQSVGIATSDATKIAQILSKNNYATVKSIRTEQFVPNQDRENSRFQIKLVVLLEKTAQFDKLTESIVLRA